MPKGSVARVGPARLDWALEAMAGELWWLAEGRLDLPTPSCPDWRMRDLVHHLGNVALYVRACLDAGGPQPEFTDAAPPADAVLIDWARRHWQGVTIRLAGCAPDAPAWNWSLEAPVAPFWTRCLTHEVVVHAWDAAQAVGASLIIPADIAVDGVDEILTTHLPAGAEQGRHFPPRGQVQVRSTDTGHGWQVRTSPYSVRADVVDPGDADLLEAGCVELYLGLWGRRALPVQDGRPDWPRLLAATGD